jgi:hypothetical protein
MQHRSIDYTFSPSRDQERVTGVSSMREENVDAQTREADVEAFDRLVANRALVRPRPKGATSP